MGEVQNLKTTCTELAIKIMTLTQTSCEPEQVLKLSKELYEWIIAE